MLKEVFVLLLVKLTRQLRDGQVLLLELVLQREELLAGILLGPTQEGGKLTVVLSALLK